MRRTSIFLYFITVVLAIIAFGSRASATQWVPVEGQVMFSGTPLCAMVLANGQNMFSCSGDGSFKLSVPLDGSDQVTLFAFASGFASFRRILTVQEALNYVVNMEREVDGRTLTVSEYFLDAERDNWSVVSGTVKCNGNPVCAMILANGQHMFSCGANLGKFYFEAPKDSNGNITLFAFASGFQPYEKTSSANPSLNDTGIIHCADDTSVGWICPISTHPGQDAEHGRDVTHNDDSDGHAGFSFTKLDANGSPLLASATSWSCVRDNVTGLIWEVKTNDGGLQDKDNNYTWYNPDSANNAGDAGTKNGGTCTVGDCDTQGYVEAVNAQGLCGVADWRMPTIKELENIASQDSFDPAIDTDYFPNTKSMRYWSDSPYAYNSSYAWRVYFYYGYSYSTPKNLQLKVRLVRAGE